MQKILRNPTLSDIVITDTGVTLAANSSYIIPPQDFLLWAYSKDIVPYIVSKDVIVSDGEDDLPVRAAIGVIQDNQLVIAEHYMLTDGEEVLIGDGKILHYSDMMWTTDNVPFYMDTESENEEDYPEVL